MSNVTCLTEHMNKQTNKQAIYRVNETSNQPCGNFCNTALINLSSVNTHDWYTLPHLMLLYYTFYNQYIQPWKVTQSIKLHWNKLAYSYFLYIFDTHINTSTNERVLLNQGCTNFPNIQKPLQNSMYQKDNMK
jgi:hypothetical protein